MTNTIDLTEFDHWVLDPKIRAVIDRCKMLSAEVERLRGQYKEQLGEENKLLHRIMALKSQRDELAGALEPFERLWEITIENAPEGDYVEKHETVMPHLKLEDLQQAAAALVKVRQGTGGDSHELMMPVSVIDNIVVAIDEYMPSPEQAKRTYVNEGRRIASQHCRQFIIEALHAHRPATQDDELHCPLCGYTKEDEAIHMDHHLCEVQGGKIPTASAPQADEPALHISELGRDDDAPRRDMERLILKDDDRTKGGDTDGK